VKPFVLSLPEMRRIWGDGFTDAELIDMAKRASTIAYLILGRAAERQAASAAKCEVDA
jgi:hypothetical protein